MEKLSFYGRAAADVHPYGSRTGRHQVKIQEEESFAMTPKKRPPRIARKMAEWQGVCERKSMRNAHVQRTEKGLRKNWKVGMPGRGV
jgi:hypothetical protein